MQGVCILGSVHRPVTGLTPTMHGTHLLPLDVFDNAVVETMNMDRTEFTHMIAQRLPTV